MNILRILPTISRRSNFLTSTRNVRTLTSAINFGKPPSKQQYGQNYSATTWSFSLNQIRRNLCSGEREVSSFNVQDYDDFKERVLKASKPVVVDFYADWCGPCKMLGPRLEMVVDNRKGKVMLAKVNIDECQDLAMDYGVRSVPTIIGFRQGQPTDQIVGLQEEEQLNAFVNKLEKSE